MDIKLLTETATLPTRGSSYSAGYDLYADIDTPIAIMPHKTAKIGTGIAIALPVNTFGGIFSRSGLAVKRGLRIQNGIGVIDADYRGECIVALHNDTDEIQMIEPQERIAQLIVIPYINVDFNVVDELDATERGDGGFGSTGTT